MRYDFGKVYKDIRESKGLTQEEVCGKVLSRTSLSKFESGKATPKYENMEFLLRQINMSFEEFEYICHLYQPSQRTEIMQTYLNTSSIFGTSSLVNLFETCQDYLKIYHDLPIKEIRDMLEVVIYIRQHGTGQLSIQVEQTVKKLWEKIEKQDTMKKLIALAALSTFAIAACKDNTQAQLKPQQPYCRTIGGVEGEIISHIEKIAVVSATAARPFSRKAAIPSAFNAAHMAMR